MKIVMKIIVGILAVVYFAFVIVNTVLMLNINRFGTIQFDDRSIITINSELSSDKYKKGDLLIVKKPKIENIKLGDEIFIYKIPKGGAPVIDVGIIGEIYLENKVVSFENGAGYEMDYVIGGTEKVINDIGTYFSIVQSQWGFLFIILIPSFLIFIYELYAIIVEIKYGKVESK